jgi:hypothetical protein
MSRPVRIQGPRGGVWVRPDDVLFLEPAPLATAASAVAGSTCMASIRNEEQMLAVSLPGTSDGVAAILWPETPVGDLREPSVSLRELAEWVAQETEMARATSRAVDGTVSTKEMSPRYAGKIDLLGALRERFLVPK